MTEQDYLFKDRPRIFPSIQEIAAFLITQWCALGLRAVAERGVFSVALSGGKTPIDIYQALAREVRPPGLWKATHVFLTDERFVPPGHPDSNLRMIRETLLSPAGVPEQNIHAVPFMETTANAARRYAADLQSFFSLGAGDIPRFDFVFLGVGEDGHTASLFPGMPPESLNDALVLSVTGQPVKHHRISLSLAVLNAARQVFIVATGNRKAVVIKKIFEQPLCLLPAAMVHPQDGQATFLLDTDAARFLKI